MVNFQVIQMCRFQVPHVIVWTSMVLLVHKESKSTNEFNRFCNELGEF
jgi:hypothetical protein